MDSLPIQAIKREERLSERVAKQLEDLILRGVLKTAQRLPAERELAEMFGVSRTVIREALHNLSARGLMDIRIGGGAFVRGPSTDSVVKSLSLLLRSRSDGIAIDNLHEVRRVLEVEIAGRAAQRASEEDVTDLEDVLRRMEEKACDLEACVSLDVEFHQALAVAAHNPLYIILLDSIGDLLLEVRRMAFQDPATAPKALQHHRSVLAAVRSGEPEQARQAMTAHMAEARDTTRKALAIRGHLQTLFRSSEDATQNER